MKVFLFSMVELELYIGRTDNKQKRQLFFEDFSIATESVSVIKSLSATTKRSSVIIATLLLDLLLRPVCCILTLTYEHEMETTCL